MARKKKKVAPKRKRALSVKRGKKRATRKPKTSKRGSRKNISRIRVTRRRKRTTSKASRKTTRAKISSPGAKPFYITREKIKYQRSRTVTQKKRKYHVTGIEKEFENFYRKHKRKGKSFIGRLRITINSNGKKVKQWVSIPRRFLPDEKSAKEYLMRGLTDDLKKLLRKYEIERHAQDIRVQEIQFEVKSGKPISEIPSYSNQNTAKARKKWGRQRKPPA